MKGVTGLQPVNKIARIITLTLKCDFIVPHSNPAQAATFSHLARVESTARRGVLIQLAHGGFVIAGVAEEDAERAGFGHEVSPKMG